jgi:hypothetical protein
MGFELAPESRKARELEEAMTFSRVAICRVSSIPLVRAQSDEGKKRAKRGTNHPVSSPCGSGSKQAVKENHTHVRYLEAPLSLENEERDPHAIRNQLRAKCHSHSGYTRLFQL